MSEKKKAPRLTEEQVHAACDELMAMGQEPSTLSLYDRFKHGSYTTFQKFLESWLELRKEQKNEIAALPKVVALPERLTKDGEDFIKKIWHLAQSISDEDIEAERERIRIAEKEMKAKLDVLAAFSEKQSNELEGIQGEYDELNDKHNELTSNHAVVQQKYHDEQAKNAALQVELTRAVEQVNSLADIVSSLETKIALIAQEKEQLTKTVAERDAAIVGAKKAHESAISKLEAKHVDELNRLTKAHDQTLSEVKAGNAKAMSDSENAHKVIVDQLNAAIVGLTADKQSQSGSIKELQSDIKSLQNDAKALQKQLDETKKQQKQPVSAKNKAEKQAAVDEKS